MSPACPGSERGQWISASDACATSGCVYGGGLKVKMLVRDIRADGPANRQGGGYSLPD